MSSQNSDERLSSISTTERETGRHKCRPVHPECSRLSSKYHPCTCRLLWGLSHAIAPSLPTYVRRDLQTKWGRHLGERGRGPELDEPTTGMTSVPDGLGIDAYDDRLKLSNEIDGFWKESEFRSQFVDLPTEVKKDDENA